MFNLSRTWRAVAAAITLALVAVIAISAVPAVSADPVAVTNCGGEAAALQVTSLDVTPQPLVPGQLASATISGTLSQRLSVVKAKLTLTKDGMNIFSHSIYVPVFAGPGEATVKVPLYVPTSVQSGEYGVTVSATTLKGQVVGCTSVAVTVAQPVEASQG